jgi:pSer/pThr/pTyr-binding forkhead associated (FHA) protein
VLVLEGRREPVPAAGGTVGRSRECDVVIASAEVSRQHMELRPRGEGWIVFDLGSTNGVRLNGRPVGGPDDPAPVRPGDRIDLGTVSLKVEAGA